MDLSIPLPSRAGATRLSGHRCCPRGGCSKDRDGQELSGSAGFPPPPPWTQPNHPSKKKLGKEKLPEGQTHKPGDDLRVWVVTADTLHENFTPEPPNFSSFPI